MLVSLYDCIKGGNLTMADNEKNMNQFEGLPMDLLINQPIIEAAKETATLCNSQADALRNRTQEERAGTIQVEDEENHM